MRSRGPGKRMSGGGMGGRGPIGPRTPEHNI